MRLFGSYNIRLPHIPLADDFLGIIISVLKFLVLYIISLLSSFAVGYFTGILLEYTIGGWLADGMSLLLDATIEKESIPLIVGVLGTIKDFFSLRINRSSFARNTKNELDFQADNIEKSDYKCEDDFFFD